MIPLNRKERYLNQIVGWGNTAPEKPLTPEEFFFSAILGEDVQLPDLKNATRYELFLAKIAGININISPPTYTSPRIEFFLARAAGMNVPELVPLTREEIFWSNYVAVVEKILEGLPPLTYKAKKAGTLIDYRIYGQTSRNLFDGELAQGYYSDTAGSSNDLISSTIRVAGTSFIPVSAGSVMALAYESTIGITKHLIYYYNNDKELINVAGWYITGSSFTIPDNISFIRVVWAAKEEWSSGYIYITLLISDISNIMLNSGATPLPYEPHGESVGDRTGNLFDMKKFAELCYPRYASVTFADNTLSFTSTAVDAYVNIVHGEGATVADEYRPSCIDVMPSTTYTISMSSAPKCYISWVDSLYKTVSTYTRIPANQSSYTFTTPNNCTKILICLGKEVNNIGDEFTISNIMLNLGSTPLPYEPYGYKVPVTISNGTDTLTTPIYLPEQIKKVGDEAEYIDYGEQKLHRVGAEDIDVTLPALPTVAGTNVLSVGTEVQPSNVYIEYEGVRGE